MAAFTTLALLGLAGAAGLIGGKKIGASQAKKASDQSVVTPPPSSATTIAAPPTAPPSTTQQSSVAQAAGRMAAAKLKRRNQINSSIATSTLTAPAAQLRRPTLIGGGY